MCVCQKWGCFFASHLSGHCKCPRFIARQDLALPFIASGRFEYDTLFLVFENDFRFRAGDYPEPAVRSAAELREAGLAPHEAIAPLRGYQARVVEGKQLSRHDAHHMSPAPAWTRLPIMSRSMFVILM